MHNQKYSLNDSYKNSYWVVGIFFCIILFQVTALKYIWSLEVLSKNLNILILFFLIFYGILNVLTQKFDKQIWYYYLLPGILVMVGMMLNVTYNVLFDIGLLSTYGLVIPWAAYIITPALVKKRIINTSVLWNYYYKFLVWFNILGLLDYVLVFGGYISFKPKKTPFGLFSMGKFSLLYPLEDGELHFRYYSCFLEPGTLAMFLLPAIAYAFFNKKYIGLAILLTSFFLTYSLGGIFSLVLLVLIIMFILFRKAIKKALLGFFIIILTSLTIWFTYGDFFKQSFEDKGESKTVREDNFTNSIIKLPELMLKYPIGLPLVVKTEDYEKNKDYLGSNFTPANAFHIGGFISFLGYILILVITVGIALTRVLFYSLNTEENIVFSSLIVLFPFVIQRSVVWDSALFGFLFAPTIIQVLLTKKKVSNLKNETN
jgi:hypothetical protein